MEHAALTVCYNRGLTTTNRHEAEHQKLRMPGLPMVEIDPKASHTLSPHIAPGIHQAEELFGFIATKELRIQELGHPIHFVRIGQVKGDLEVFVGVLNHDDTVVVNVCALPFALEEDCAT